jgi:hypothetical protein
VISGLSVPSTGGQGTIQGTDKPLITGKCLLTLLIYFLDKHGL